MAKPILYSFSHSSCTWRVRLALNYKDIAYETRVVNLSRGETRDPEFLKVNPAGHIPALVVNGKVLAQSMAILEYIEEAYPEKPLLPKDLIQRAKVREICELIVSGIQPLQHRQVAGKYSDDKQKQLEWQDFYIHRGLTALERILTDCSGKYAVGDDFTLADCCLIPQVFNAEHRFKMDMSGFPRINEINKNLSELPAFKTAHPDAQID
ncbi:unnamed protein product [Allacma fusca]|uniref:maleylacetoacetate isomerase n=1 Tax=Allacma fusca TaxID=39272 RepID=A0A8J2PPE9_9HEXA|nr:unnamed protein product [Allacma fusca]